MTLPMPIRTHTRAVLILLLSAASAGCCDATGRKMVGPGFALPPESATLVARVADPATTPAVEEVAPATTPDLTTEPTPRGGVAIEPPADRFAVPDMAEQWDYFTGGARTFSPLIADPRWPGFLTTYRFQSGGRFLNEYEAVNLGAELALARGPAKFFGTVFETEIGVMGGTFSVFDPGHMQDLVAIDYMGSLYGSIRRGRFSALARYWHLSAHAGDEFILSDNYGGAGRNDLLLENLQFLASYDFDHGIRVYGGPTYRADVAPDEYGSFQLQYGVEYQSETRYGDARPILGIDGQSLSGYDFAPTISVRGGLGFDHGERSPSFRVIGEFLVGRDPNGQFFDDHVLYTGLGVQFKF